MRGLQPSLCRLQSFQPLHHLAHHLSLRLYWPVFADVFLPACSFWRDRADVFQMSSWVWPQSFLDCWRRKACRARVHHDAHFLTGCLLIAGSSLACMTVLPSAVLRSKAARSRKASSSNRDRLLTVNAKKLAKIYIKVPTTFNAAARPLAICRAWQIAGLD